MLLWLLAGNSVKRKQNNKHEEAMADKENTIKLAEQDDKTKIELAKLELEMKKAELESAEKIAKIEAEAMSKNQVNDLRQYAGSREYANYNSGRRGRGSRPWA